MGHLVIEIMLILILLDIHIILFCYMLRIALQTVNYVKKFKRGKGKAQYNDEKNNEKSNVNKETDLYQEKPYHNKVFYDIKKSENMEKSFIYTPGLDKKLQGIPSIKEMHTSIPIKTNDSMEQTVVRLGNVAEGSINSYGISESVKEKKNGELKITSKEGNIVYVMPYNTILTEQTFKNTLIEKYFEVSQRVMPGGKFKVKRESKAASLRRQEDEFFLVNRGYLELEEH